MYIGEEGRHAGETSTRRYGLLATGFLNPGAQVVLGRYGRCRCTTLRMSGSSNPRPPRVIRVRPSCREGAPPLHPWPWQGNAATLVSPDAPRRIHLVDKWAPTDELFFSHAALNMPDWTAATEELGATTQRIRILVDGVPASYAAVLDGLSDREELRCLFLASLRDSGPAAFFWETPPVTSATVQQIFECVVIAAPSLGRTGADPSSFREHLADVPPERGVVCFPSLRGDALLVVPAPRAEPDVYAHLASFVRGAPANQQHELLEAVAAAMRGRIGPEPTWLSTAGLGVPWLHVRLDSTPKYYRFDAYRGV